MTTTQTSTTQTSTIRLKGASEASALPDAVKERLATVPKLSREQAGHIRHFHNLASQLDGDWSFFGTQDPGQEWLDAIRYQLAIMSYGVAAAHFHRLPALRAPMRELLRKLIGKMLRRDVWGYWYLTSQSGIFVDPDLKELRKPWSDPVKEENIMYSGHLLLMVSMYEMLFDSDEFEHEGSITFNWDPIFWGFGPEKFEYSRKSIQDVIIGEMEKNDWVGVCCEPNMVFVVCNQFPVTAMRFADVHNGTNIVDGVLEKYSEALKRKGMIHDKGTFADAYRVKQKQALPAFDIGFTAWACNWMNGWNSEYVHDMYQSQALGVFTNRGDGRVNVEPPDVAAIIRKLASTEERDPDSEEVRKEALKEAKAKRPAVPPIPYTKPIFGLAMGWVAELATTAPGLLDGLLKHSDTFLNPCWSRGGLYYPRNDVKEDEDGNWRFMDPVTGNAAIGYARLNVPDGQKKMWEGAWTPEQVRNYPAIEDVGYGENVDFLRCQWVTESEYGINGFVMTMRTWSGQNVTIKPKITGLGVGQYDIFVDGTFLRSHSQKSGEDLQLAVEVGDAETDVCILQK